MTDNYLLGLLGAILLGAAVALWRRPGGDDGALLVPSITMPWDEPAADEPDQLPGAVEAMLVFMDPGTYAPAMVSQDQAQANMRAFLQMIRYAEGTAGSNGYRMLFGGQTFASYADHPRIYVPFRDTTSSAAGAYQILWRTWVTLKARLGLPDFSPESQDAAALELIRERGALNDVQAGRMRQAVAKVAKVWASLPGAGYNQPERSIDNLAAAFAKAGGVEQA